MELSSATIAHALIAQDGCITDVDAAYATLLGRPREAVISHNTLEFTHVDDRPACSTMRDRVWRDGVSRSGTMRHIRLDGSFVWVSVHISTVGIGATRQFVVSSRKLDRACPGSPIQSHWQMARTLARALNGGKRAFGKALIGNPAAEMLLLLYIAEAEARPALAKDLGARCAVEWPLARRWFNVLQGAGFVEPEVDGEIAPTTPMRLTIRGLAIMEDLLTTLSSRTGSAKIPA